MSYCSTALANAIFAWRRVGLRSRRSRAVRSPRLMWAGGVLSLVAAASRVRQAASECLRLVEADGDGQAACCLRASFAVSSAAMRLASARSAGLGWESSLGSAREDLDQERRRRSVFGVGLQILLQNFACGCAVLAIQVDFSQRVKGCQKLRVGCDSRFQRRRWLRPASCARSSSVAPDSASAWACKSTASGRFFSTSSTKLACRSASSGSPSLSFDWPSKNANVELAGVALECLGVCLVDFAHSTEHRVEPCPQQAAGGRCLDFCPFPALARWHRVKSPRRATKSHSTCCKTRLSR